MSTEAPCNPWDEVMGAAAEVGYEARFATPPVEGVTTAQEADAVAKAILAKIRATRGER